MLFGGLPVDVRYLELVAQEVRLTAYCSTWLPARIPTASVPPRGVPVRRLRPVVRAERGHLAFCYAGLRSALDADRPDVVHVLSEPWGLLAVQAARWVRTNPPARLVLHGCDTIWHHGSRSEQLVRRSLLRRTLPTTHAWAAESGKALGVARRNGLPAASRTARIHTNPRDAATFRRPDPGERARARAGLGLVDNRPAIGILGRLVPEKGIRLFLDAADALQRQGFPGRFLVAGDGPLRDEVQRRATDHLRPLGGLAHPVGVQTFFHALDVITCPSLTTPDWEDQGPRSLLEAMMCGCIPVGTPTGAIPEMLAGHGVLAESVTAPAVAHAIGQAAAIAADPARADDLARWAQSIYSSDAGARQLVDLWRSVAGPGGHG
jgi:glycosyltransferase involved in cell wall biosynthesis